MITFYAATAIVVSQKGTNEKTFAFRACRLSIGFSVEPPTSIGV
jgi:hypothetical protein